MLSASDRRTATLGALFVALMVGSRFGLPAFQRWADERRHAAERTIHDLQLTRLAIERPAEVRQSGAAVQSIRRTYREWVMPADQHSVMGIGLARILSDIAQAEGVELSSVLPLNEGKPRQFLRQVRARASFSGDLESVLHFVAALEGRRPRLLIRQLSLSPTSVSQNAAAGQLRGELVVESLVSVAGTQP
ncbi:MAG: type II secretion system protein GspM [Gemmatimonadaceae bacterium]